jgi:hypothetical protein
VEVGGIDFSVWKVHLIAKELSLLEEDQKLRLKQARFCTCLTSKCCNKCQVPPSVEQSYPDLGLSISVMDGDDLITNEVKKCGLLIDRGLDLELRAGDELTVYVSMGGFEK